MSHRVMPLLVIGLLLFSPGAWAQVSDGDRATVMAWS